MYECIRLSVNSLQLHFAIGSFWLKSVQSDQFAYWLEITKKNTKIKEMKEINMWLYPSNTHALQTPKWWLMSGQKATVFFIGVP